MGHRIKLKGCGNGPGQQPIPGELENECRFCDTNFADPRQAVNHYMGKKHQVRLYELLDNILLNLTHRHDFYKQDVKHQEERRKVLRYLCDQASKLKK